MKSIFKKLFLKPRKAIPKEWLGIWIDKTGRILDLEEDISHNLTVSVNDKVGSYFLINLLGNNKKETRNLLGRFSSDGKGNPYLEIEAGEKGLGPTYQLYFIIELENKDIRLAEDNDHINKIRIRPNIGLGLYNDWEDDLGVPWAFPLEDFKKKNNAT